MIKEQDIEALAKKNITEEMLQEQLECFRNGFSFLKIISAASVDKGIKVIDDENDEKTYLDAWGSYLSLDKKIFKFVPASGAASRMFKGLFEFLSASYVNPATPFEVNFFENIEKFAFYLALDKATQRIKGKTVKELIEEHAYKEIVSIILTENGLNYSFLPKGLLDFHRYGDYVCTPVEEHMKEGYMYACNTKNEVNLHFTVSPEHRDLFLRLVNDKKVKLESEYNVNYNISFSEQKPSTETVAVTLDNEPFRDAEDNIVFRPGGHGALIENLNGIDADIVYIKNIDNVALDTEAYRADNIKYKQLLGGVLVSVQKKIFEYLKLIDNAKYTHEDLLEMLQFVQKTLNIKNPQTKLLEDAELVLYIKRKLDRPCRVCGMVRNVGEPGGGPFLAVNEDETVSPQILESSQINMSDLEAKAMFEHGTHFNPVDLVCGIKDYRGQSFNLRNFVDASTGFISLKSKDGRELKALELPGLWNGAMSDWNTIFVEVPVSTFNPVKSVEDLMRKQHAQI